MRPTKHRENCTLDGESEEKNILYMIVVEFGTRVINVLNYCSVELVVSYS